MAANIGLIANNLVQRIEGCGQAGGGRGTGVEPSPRSPAYSVRALADVMPGKDTGKPFLGGLSANMPVGLVNSPRDPCLILGDT
jgi:hypothetical protein